MILEKRGTPDILKEIIKENYNNIQTILSNNKNYSLVLNIDKSAQLENKIIYLKCNLTINFIFGIGNKYTGNINYLSIIESNFKNCIIDIFLPLNPELNISISTMSHELLHLYKLYQIKEIFNKTRWQDTTTIIDLEKMSIMNYKSVEYFKNLIYLSLPHEIRARITSLHFYLLSFRTNDKEFLLKKLEETKEFRYFNMLKNFDVEEYYKILMLEMDVDSAINIFSFLNEKLNIKFKILNEKDLIKFFYMMKKYFSDILKSYDKKISRIIKDLSNEKFEYIHHDRHLLSFEELTELKITEKEKDIDYKLYFIKKSN
jgi:hypothetical protein